ncbi:endomembrane protein 70-like protein [Achlya hypogyna]|uniref:Endomembrane protein 70-like protein n=1 Tax=Achlya hypogyna TaxID=1202772 RepID=A0A1V9YH93_ACHHY|nr:endomembrane protein 70-like protein [Achlya hypogyna]
MTLFTLYATVLSWLTHRAQHRHPRLQSMFAFFATMVAGELPHLLLVGHAVAMYYRRASLQAQRKLGLLHGYVLLRLVQLYRDNVATKHVFQEACIRKQLLSPSTAVKTIGHRSAWQMAMIWSPLPMKLALRAMYPGIQFVGSKVYAHVGSRVSTPLFMDFYKHENCGPKPPIFLFIHGGGWLLGNRSYAPQALLHQVCSKGWLFCSIDYRLAPFNCFPQNLTDCKRAIAYLRTATDLDLDQHTIVVGGESAGGHLAALVAVTADEKRFQPGFEDVDTSVAACVDTYGIHDLLDRYGHFGRRDLTGGFRKYMEVALMQKKLMRKNEPAFAAASALQYVLDGAKVPPFLIVHGEYDSVVPYEDSKEFYDALQATRDRSHRVPDIFVKVPHAQHAFNIFTSPRALAYGDTVVAFLEAVRAPPLIAKL